MLAIAAGFANQSFPSGRRVGIITNAGGPAILCTDACEASGLIVPELSVQTKTRLGTFLPSTAARTNPIDLIASASPQQYADAITTMLAAVEIDALIIIYVSVTVVDTAGIAEGIKRGIEKGRATASTSKPVFLVWMAEGDSDRIFTVAGETIPVYVLPETPAVVLGKMASSAEWQQRAVGVVPDFDDLNLSTARTLCTTALSQRGNGWMTTEETRSLLRAVKLPVQPGGVALTADEAVAVAEKIGWPVAVKLASHQIVHKTEFGGVHLNLTNERSVRHAFASITSELEKRNTLAAMEGVLVQPMLTGGVEVMVGVTHDPLFGPLIAFGLGGIHVEILGDVQFRITPLTEDDAIEMIRGIKGYSLLRGYRNQQPADTQALEEVLLRISRLVEEIPEIYELDLNPIFALPPGEGCRILDARIGVSRLTAGLANR